MAKPAKIYTRLTRSAASVGSYSSLWLAADHLLIVSSNGYSETYSRLSLRDIKGVFIVRNDRRLWWGMLWGFIAALSAIFLIVGLVYSDPDPPIVSGIFFVIGGSLFWWNQALGVGCKAYAVTGVQTAVLPSLVRVKKARKVLARLQPLIEAAQADLQNAPPASPSDPPVIA